MGLVAMNRPVRAMVLVLALAAQFVAASAVHQAQVAPAVPIALNPDNPHYFQWRGRPTILITSAEHYGAVMNLDFDYRKYLGHARRRRNELHACVQRRLRRARRGVQNRPQHAGAAAGAVPCSLAAQQQSRRGPVIPDGGNKFDLSRWDDAYFARLKDFVAHAAARNVVVELTLFCPMYEEVQWSLSPMNAANNVNGAGKVGRNEVYTLDKDPALLAVQEALTRKLVTELNVVPEPLLRDRQRAVFRRRDDGLAASHRGRDRGAERALPAKHLIAQNIANKSAKIADPHPAVSIFNFHYATPPETVAMNYALNKVIGDDETGFKGVSDDVYRMEAWDFLIAGGGLYNNLDYSFTAGHEDGTFNTRRRSQAAAAAPCAGN